MYLDGIINCGYGLHPVCKKLQLLIDDSSRLFSLKFSHQTFVTQILNDIIYPNISKIIYPRIGGMQ
jgi:hypothetical protein